MSVEHKPFQDGRNWVVRVKRGGRYLPQERFDTEAEAKRRERQLKGISELVGSGETVRQFAERWLDDYPEVKHGPTAKRPRSLKTRQLYELHLRRLCAELGAYPMSELGRREARAFAVRDPRSAVVARNMYSSALEDGFVAVNPFQGLRIGQPKGRKDYAPLSVQQFHDLADLAALIHSEIGAMLRAQILFTCYVGPRLTEGLHLQWDEIDRKAQEVHFSVCKFDKQRTVLLLPEAVKALDSMPRRKSSPYVFYPKRETTPAKPLTASNHFHLWNPVRHAFWQMISEAERKELVDLDWHTLRHTCGHYFYVTRDFTDEMTAAQLGHSDAALIRNLYGHGRHGVLERMKQRLAA